MLAIKQRFQSVIQRRIIYNERLQDLTWRHFYTPDRNTPSVSLSGKGQKHLAELREAGITLIPGYEAAADHVAKTYLPALDGCAVPEGLTFDRLEMGARAATTGTASGRVSYTDPGLRSLVFDETLAGILYNYYQRQPYYREHPRVIRNQMTKNPTPEALARAEVSSKFHIDCYRQISCMLLLGDLTENDTHLEYALRSHNERHPWNRYTYDEQSVLAKYEMLQAVGKRGTLIVMDAGAGLHRGVHKAGTSRKILHFNVTTGHYFSGDPKIAPADLPDLSERPDHVRRMLDHLTA